MLKHRILSTPGMRLRGGKNINEIGKAVTGFPPLPFAVVLI